MSRILAPGLYVVEQPGTPHFQARMLFRDYHSPAARLFIRLNTDNYLLPGQVMIVIDPDMPPAMPLLRRVWLTKQQINRAFVGVSAEEASFMQRHYGIIAGLTGAGDKIFSTVGDAGETYFKSVGKTLTDIEASYQNQYRAQGTLNSQQFFAERGRLLHQLKTLVNQPLLKSLARNIVELRPYDDMTRALNLSSRSIVHQWSINGVGGIPGYEHYVGNAATASRFLKKGGYLGIMFSFGNVTNEVIHACTTDRENECGRVAFKEYFKFGIGTTAGVVGGTAGASTMGAICTGLGIITAPGAGMGGLACAVVGATVAGYAATSTTDSILDYVYRTWNI